MSKREDQRIAALVKKNMAKIKPPVADNSTQFDATLRIRPSDESADTKRLFKDMKKREF